MISEIIDLDDTNKLRVLDNSVWSLIYFNKSSCSYCEQFTPVYQELSQLYDNDEEFQILRAQSNNKQLVELFHVKQYPTIKLLNYKTKEILTFDESRNLVNMINFINDNTDAINKHFQSQVEIIGNKDEFYDFISQPTTVIFTMSYFPQWEETQFPSHFYQQLAHDYDHKFGIMFVDLISDVNSILEQYKIGNYPCIIHFSNKNQFKTFKTSSADHLNSETLNEDDVRLFLHHLDSENMGYSFTTFDELNEFIENQKVTTQPKGKGMHIQHSTNDNSLHLEQDYQDLLQGISL